MKFELSDRDQKMLNSAMERNPLRNFLLNREFLNFEVGDVLVKNISRYDWNTKTNFWVKEPISSSNSMAQRYVVIHKDEFGICFAKELKVSTGKLGSDLYCIADYDYKETRFEVDPEYAEQIFLDGDFNIKDIHTKSLEARKIITKMNRKVGIKFDSLKDSNWFFGSLKVGDHYWSSSDFTAKYVVDYEITSIIKLTIQEMEAKRNYSWQHFRDRAKNDKKEAERLNDTFAYLIKVKENGSNRERDIHSFDHGRGNVFYKSPPAQEEKKK
jgi:hypothetical protein